MANFELKKVYNFQTLAPTIIGNEHTNMKVKAILTSDNALKFRDIATLHQTVKNIISGLPESITDLTYVLFETVDKENVVLALEYINTDSITEVTSVNIRINIMRCTTEDISMLRLRLQELGYTNFTISTYE